MGIMPGLAAVEMHQGCSLTNSVELVSEKTSQKVASTSLAILACWSSCFVAILVCQSSYFLANPSHLWASSHLSWALAQVMLCTHIRAGLRLSPSLQSVSSLLDKDGRRREGTTAAQDLTGCGPPQHFPTMLPGGMNRLLAPPPPSHVAG